MTQYPSQRERAAIRAAADAGDESARNYLDLLDACIQCVEVSNGISLARGMVGEHNDVYGHAIDDALSDLMPVVFRVCAGGWDGLKWYVPEEVQGQNPPTSDNSGKQELLDTIEQQTIFAVGELAIAKIGLRPDLAKVENYLGEIIRSMLELKKVEGIPSKLSIADEEVPPQE